MKGRMLISFATAMIFWGGTITGLPTRQITLDDLAHKYGDSIRLLVKPSTIMLMAE